jgi:hypothetical protein
MIHCRTNASAIYRSNSRLSTSEARQVGTQFRRALTPAPFGIDEATDDVIFY